MDKGDVRKGVKGPKDLRVPAKGRMRGKGNGKEACRKRKFQTEYKKEREAMCGK
jgi:hypothetical protein